MLTKKNPRVMPEGVRGGGLRAASQILELLGHLEYLEVRLGLLGLASTGSGGFAGALLCGHSLGVTAGFAGLAVGGEACGSCKHGEGQGNNNFFHSLCEYLR